jgi:Chaperone of endosialidase
MALDRLSAGALSKAGAGNVDDSVMSLVRQLRGVSFEWRSDIPSADGRSGSDLGVIAQEVEQVFPELVTTDEHGYKLVNYAGLIAPLIEALKELDARLGALENANHRRTSSGDKANSHGENK